MILVYLKFWIYILVYDEKDSQIKTLIIYHSNVYLIKHRCLLFIKHTNWFVSLLFSLPMIRCLDWTSTCRRPITRSSTRTWTSPDLPGSFPIRRQLPPSSPWPCISSNGFKLPDQFQFSIWSRFYMDFTLINFYQYIFWFLLLF